MLPYPANPVAIGKYSYDSVPGSLAYVFVTIAEQMNNLEKKLKHPVVVRLETDTKYDPDGKTVGATVIARMYLR